MMIGPPRSLFGQFVALHIAVALVAAITLLWSASALLHQTANHFQRGLLHRQAAISASFAAVHPRRVPSATLANGMAVAWIDHDRRVFSAEGLVRPDILAAAPLDRVAHFFRRSGVEAYSLPAGAGWIVVSQDDADPAVVTDDIVRSFLLRFALISLPIAALVPLFGALLTRRLTLRMRAVSAIAATIGPRSLDRRLPRGLLPLEAEPLAEATNAALDRLATAIHVQTAFAADVAHELRTPLAIARLRADAVADPEIRDGIMSAVDRAARIIAQLLALAELERPIDDGGGVVDLHALAERVVADRAPAILASGRTIALEEGGAAPQVRGYPAALTMALENLIDNATRHTTSGTAILVRSGPGGQLMVSDDGDPIPETHFMRLKDRLWRGTDPAIEGAGIGLSIVERVAHAHQGSLTVRRGQGRRGLIFLITLDEA